MNPLILFHAPLYPSLRPIHQGLRAVDVFCTKHFPCVLFSETSLV
jgi:hypothetical protein